MLIVALFTAFMLILAWGILRNKSVHDPVLQSYSIIVACRNEEKNLPSLLDSLGGIEYPDFEIILVDDASEDRTYELLNNFCKDKANAACVRIEHKDDKLRGKKAALTIAARKARKAVLLFTDADCIAPPNWLDSYNRYFGDNTGMVVGFSPENTTSEFRNFTQLGTAATFACTIGLGFPFSCTGRNLAIRRDVFFAVRGYEPDGHLAAGDDKGILNRVYKAGYPIAYNPEAPVRTIPTQNGYADQQLRRYSKFGMSRLPYQLLTLAVFAYFVYLPVNLFNGNWDALLLHWFGFSVVWGANLKLHRQRFDLRHFVYLLYYPYYISFWTIAGFFRKWKWK